MIVDGESLSTSTLISWAFRRTSGTVEVPSAVLSRAEKSHHSLQRLMEKQIPIYGVTTGFGDSGYRTISAHQSETLQRNLISYLLCGSGPTLLVEASRAILTVRLNS